MQHHMQEYIVIAEIFNYLISSIWETHLAFSLGPLLTMNNKENSVLPSTSEINKRKVIKSKHLLTIFNNDYYNN